MIGDGDENGILHKNGYACLCLCVCVRESWIRGYPDSRTMFIDRTIEASRYKTQDFGSCPDGTLLCVVDKLGNPDIMFPSL